MRLGGRLAAASEILTDIEERRRPVADALKDWGLSHRFAGSGDRAAIGTLVYDALRMRRSHAYLMASDAPAAACHAVLLRQWDYTPETLANELSGDNFAPAALQDESWQAFRARELKDAPEAIQADLPDWAMPAFRTAFGDQWIAEAQAMAARPPLDLRVNTLKADRTKVEKALSRTGARPSGISPTGLRIAAASGAKRHPNVTSELAFQKGWFEIQDEGSQIAALLAHADENKQIIDYCAGGGGKTLALSASMQNRGQIHAYDADRKRLAPIVERLRRAGTRNVQVHDSAEQLDGLSGRMDCVLVDAPCSGTGTWRRRPDTKWRLSEESLADRMAEQDRVLDQACRFVKPGGRLVYVTCSVLPGENGARVDAFLKRTPAFRRSSLERAWTSAISAPMPSHRSEDGASLLMSPASTGTDGFFVALLERAV